VHASLALNELLVFFFLGIRIKWVGKMKGIVDVDHVE
jgi:hypothetical protein